MIRIPNPGSDIDGFIRIFREIHPFLVEKVTFDIDDISEILVETNNVTAQGAIGAEALRRSRRPDRSRDPIYNQSKMYSELYRSHGWLHSTDSSLKFCLTNLGHHMAMAVDPRALMKECLLGMAFPNEVLHVKGNHILRVFGTILQTMAALGDLSRDEMIVGPLSIPNDSRPDLIKAMVEDLKKLRRTKGALDKRLDRISRDRRIKRGSTMTNYTRYPMAALPWAGWAIKPKPGILAVTDEGRAAADRVSDSHDFRLTDFRNVPDTAKRPIILSTSYRMLERGGFDLLPIKDMVVREEEVLYKAGFAPPLMFSPFQQLCLETIRTHAPEMVSTEGLDSPNTTEVLPRENPQPRGIPVTILAQVGTHRLNAPSHTKDTVNLLRKALAAARGIIPDAVEELTRCFEEANKDVFYALVVNLFNVSGLDCRLSRAGVNYERADAIILDPEANIPIEIKSPGEESEISVKGVRQALENKIVFLARKGYRTRPETTSLVVGFNPPNERSEVHELIEDMYRAFRVNIAVIDFRNLLYLALQSLQNNRPIVMPGFETMRGLVRVQITPANS